MPHTGESTSWGVKLAGHNVGVLSFGAAAKNPNGPAAAGGSTQETPADAPALYVPIVIPAYKPGSALVDLVDVLSRSGVRHIVVVNDGSSPEFNTYFEALAAYPNTVVVKHAVNLGKGAALKTGINAALCIQPTCLGVVTADADGQHAPDDILNVAERLVSSPQALILGVRAFGAGVPLRSKVGNELTRRLVRLLTGQNISDTQTGLRGIPRSMLAHLLRMPAVGYEFELDMLIACKHQECRILEERVKTIYLEENASSHFNPLMDSMRIYLVLFRFSLTSVLTALLDNLVFFASYQFSGQVLPSQIAGRVCALVFNYAGTRSMVFHSRQRHRSILPKYLFLVLLNGIVSYKLVKLFSTRYEMSVYVAKIAAESILFTINFILQRDFVFTKKQVHSKATDWDAYYQRVPATAKLTRKYTSAVLISAIRRFAPDGGRGTSILEIGGANSCFLDRIIDRIQPNSYRVVDTNKYGLELLKKRVHQECPIEVLHQSVLTLEPGKLSDVVFSVGLIEHFEPDETRKAILAHFDVAKPGSCVMVTFPTPTPIYRLARFLLKSLSLWKFPDERPLSRGEVVSTLLECGEIVEDKLLWPLILTQRLIVVRKKAALGT